MPTTATGPMTITFPDDLASFVREKVASGEYSSENAVVFDILHDYFDPQWESDEWILSEVLPALDEIDANPSLARSSDDIHRAIQQEAAMLRKQA